MKKIYEHVTNLLSPWMRFMQFNEPSESFYVLCKKFSVFCVYIFFKKYNVFCFICQAKQMKWTMLEKINLIVFFTHPNE